MDFLLRCGSSHLKFQDSRGRNQKIQNLMPAADNILKILYQKKKKREGVDEWGHTSSGRIFPRKQSLWAQTVRKKVNCNGDTIRSYRN
jgi:hypothetical protein